MAVTAKKAQPIFNNSPTIIVGINIVQDDISTAELLQTAVKDQVDASYVLDLSRVVHLYKIWKKLMPRVEPFYAMKCNSDVKMLSMLAKLGSGFDCASEGEIRNVLSLGVTTDKIIYANTQKQISHLQYAIQVGVHMSTFDSEDELIKVVMLDPKAELIIRIRADNEESAFRMGEKFGVSLQEAHRLLDLARKMNASVIGVSFHIGWNCRNPSAYGQAIEMAHQVFQYGSTIGYTFTLLDIGGGFPGHHGSEEVFEAISSVVNTSLLKFFNDERIRVVAEPGTYFAMSPFTLATCVIGRKKVKADIKENDVWHYYINEGKYGSLQECSRMLAHIILPPAVLSVNKRFNKNLTKAKICGPTCSTIDEVMSIIQLPQLSIGDWLYFENAGAYTIAEASTFNGFQRTKVQYYIKEKDAHDNMFALSSMKTGL